MDQDTTSRTDRYVRQAQWAGLGADGQRKLSAARVLIVGAGGLGSWLSELLARAGVGYLRLCDADHVDWTNLARQALYTESDAEQGVQKVQAAAEALRQINSEIEIDPRPERVTAENIAALADDVDLICDATDDWSSRRVINTYAVAAQKPWVMAGAVQAEGQVFPIVPGRSACLECLMPEPPEAAEEQARKASTVGVIAPAVAAIASYQAAATMRLLTEDQPELHLLKLDVWRGTTQRIDVMGKQDPNCTLCGHEPL